MPGPSSWPCSGSAGLQAQRVAGAEPGRRDAGADDRRPQVRRRARRHGDLDAALARVAGAGDGRTACRSTPARRRGSGRPRRRPGRPSASRSSACGPCTASTARSWVVSSPPIAARTRSVFDALGITSNTSAPVVVAGCHHTMMSSSTEPSASSSRWVYWARPGAILPRSLVSAACSAVERSVTVDPHRAEVGHVEHDGVVRGRRGARRSCRSGTRAASPSRRTAPSGRRARGGRRRAASARSVISPGDGDRRRRGRRPRRRAAASWASMSSLTPASGQHVEHALAAGAARRPARRRRTAPPGCR